jgi:hypothetical protein
MKAIMTRLRWINAPGQWRPVLQASSIPAWKMIIAIGSAPNLNMWFEKAFKMVER